MNVHIYRLRINFKIDEIRRSDSFRNKVFICLHHSLVQVRASEISSVNEEILVAETFPGRLRTADITRNLNDGSLGMHIHDIIGNTCSEHILNSELQRLGRPEDTYILAVVSQSEAHSRTGKGDSCEFSDDMLELHIVRLEELTSCRDIIEKVPDTEVGSARSCNLLRGKMLRVSIIHLTADLVLLSAGLEGHLCDSRNGCKRLASEAESQDVVQILCSLEF